MKASGVSNFDKLFFGSRSVHNLCEKLTEIAENVTTVR